MECLNTLQYEHTKLAVRYDLAIRSIYVAIDEHEVAKNKVYADMVLAEMLQVRKKIVELTNSKLRGKTGSFG